MVWVRFAARGEEDCSCSPVCGAGAAGLAGPPPLLLLLVGSPAGGASLVLMPPHGGSEPEWLLLSCGE